MNRIIKWKETLRALILYPSIRKQTKSIESNILFFFPRYQTGGAERVHLNILKAVADTKPTCFITDLSANKDLREEFRQYSTVVNLHRWGWKTSFRKRMAKKIALEINKIDNPIIFGSNSEFFYDLFPHLKPSCIKIDLLHTDLSYLPLSIENYAAPVTSMLSSRILLGEGHKEKIKKFYDQKGIAATELEKIKVIPNGISIPTSPPPSKDYSAELIVLFVSRNSYEKRPELFIKIAAEAYKRKLPFKFQMIGDFESFGENKPKNLQIVGKVVDVEILNRYYQNAHFIFITSLFEGFPMVITEGLSRGVIPMATDVGEISIDINQEDKTGLIIPNYPDTNNVVDGFINMMKAINLDRKDLAQFASNGYSLAKTKFSEDTFVQNYRNLLIQNWSHR